MLLLQKSLSLHSLLSNKLRTASGAKEVVSFSTCLCTTFSHSLWCISWLWFRKGQL